MTAIIATSLSKFAATITMYKSIRSLKNGLSKYIMCVWACLLFALPGTGLGSENLSRAEVEYQTRPFVKEAIAPRGDPDTVYQRGLPVGKVSGARIKLDQSRIYFSRVSDAGSLNTSAPFVYRGYMINFVSADAKSDGARNIYRNMVCSVRARAR